MTDWGAPVLLNTSIDEDGDMHSVYELPRAIPWEFRHFVNDSDASWEQLHQVSRVRVFVCMSSPHQRPVVGVVPYGEDGKESPINSVTLQGYSTMRALQYIGFPPDLYPN